MTGDFDPVLDLRVLICGDRNWTDGEVIATYVEGLMQKQIVNFGRLFLVEGCARGADSYACRMWDGRQDPAGGVRGTHTALVHEHHPANWKKYGKRAGPIRNREMLATRPSLVIAFHDDLDASKGTRDMVTIAKRAGTKVLLVSHPYAALEGMSPPVLP